MVSGTHRLERNQCASRGVCFVLRRDAKCLFNIKCFCCGCSGTQMRGGCALCVGDLGMKPVRRGSLSSLENRSPYARCGCMCVCVRCNKICLK